MPTVSETRPPCAVCGAAATGMIGRAGYCSAHFPDAYTAMLTQVREGAPWPGPGLRRD